MKFFFTLLALAITMGLVAQNVGIGTTSPASQLHIANTDTAEFRLENTNTGAGGRVWALASSPNTSIPSFRIIDRTSTLTRFSISNNGYVGIGLGNALATAILETGEDINVNGLRLGRGGNNMAENTALGVNALNSNNYLASNNTAIGWNALHTNTSGSSNTAVGAAALASNTQGAENTAIGDYALANSAQAAFNVAIGHSAGQFSQSGGNTFIGHSSGETSAGFGFSNSALGYKANISPNFSNATAIGAKAYVAQSNSMVLGSINGVNGATADTRVGIGTTAPTTTLDVAGGIRTSYSGTSVTSTLSSGVQIVNLTISALPANWDYTNTSLVVTNVDGGEGVIRQAKITSTTNIAIRYEALVTGAVRFNYVIFKL